jgi:glycosyltransferase involved in cell wall biosynthesis
MAAEKNPEKLKIVLVIPVYNHGKTLRDVVIRSLEVCRDVMVIDDGSTDGGAETLSGLDVKIIHHRENRGKDAAIMTAAREAGIAGATHIVTIDADGQHDPADFSRFIPLIEENPDAIIVGNRRFDSVNMPLLSRFGRSFSNFWLRVQTGYALKDTQSGFRAYPLASERVSHFHPFMDNHRLSVLNTMLTLRAIIPVLHRRFVPVKKEAEKISVFRPVRSLRILLSGDVSPERLAVAGDSVCSSAQSRLLHVRQLPSYLQQIFSA